jgi:NAD(P)-dependent dehydrogenase (short-subunit alcohol dehydrogenase family)
MRELAGRTAFVTGGANGIGLAMGRAFAEAGMKVMLADIEAAALTAAVDSLRAHEPNVRSVVCDVTDIGSVERAAEAAYQTFGKVHVVCNNAGVAAGGGSLDTWRWILDVNVMGVLHGIQTFLPHIQGHGEGGHIVNTASMAGLQSNLGFNTYATSKYAVVAMSEGLAKQLASSNIGVTVLCPGFVRTEIGNSSRNRPQRYGPQPVIDPASPGGMLVAEIARRLQAGLDPAEVAAQTLAAIRANRLYVFTHPEMRDEVDERFAAITAALDEAENKQKGGP